MQKIKLYNITNRGESGQLKFDYQTVYNLSASKFPSQLFKCFRIRIMVTGG